MRWWQWDLYSTTSHQQCASQHWRTYAPNTGVPHERVRERHGTQCPNSLEAHQLIALVSEISGSMQMMVLRQGFSGSSKVHMARQVTADCSCLQRSPALVQNVSRVVHFSSAEIRQTDLLSRANVAQDRAYTSMHEMGKALTTSFTVCARADAK